MNRKYILSPKPVGEITNSTSALQSILNNSLKILSNEVNNLLAKSSRGMALNQNEIKNLCSFLRVLLDAGKLALDQARAEDLSHLSDEQVIAMSRVALKQITKDPTNAK